jgi:hypothetical protein
MTAAPRFVERSHKAATPESTLGTHSEGLLAEGLLAGNPAAIFREPWEG